MGYSIILEQGKANRAGLRKVSILVTVDGKKMPRIDTGVKVTDLKSADHLKKNIIDSKKNEVERDILKSIQRRGKVVKEEIKSVIDNGGSLELLSDFWKAQKKALTGILSDGRLNSVNTAMWHWHNFDPDIKLNEIDGDILQKFQQYLTQLNKHGFEHNTIWKYMQCTQSVLNQAEKKKLIAKEQYIDYKWPVYQQKVPVFLTETEIERFYQQTKSIENISVKTSGYYFLLSCFAGYRISDARAFVYEERVNGQQVAVRARKNGSIVSITIYSRLAEVLDFIKTAPKPKEEPKVREDVKLIAGLAGITKHIKFHTARHSFAMLLTMKGFHVEEVAELIGDDIRTAKVYARLWNDNLNKKIMEKMG